MFIGLGEETLSSRQVVSAWSRVNDVLRSAEPWCWRTEHTPGFPGEAGRAQTGAEGGTRGGHDGLALHPGCAGGDLNLRVR